MSVFSNLVIEDDIQDENDSVGGFKRLESDIYNFIIDLAYVDKADSGAMSVNFVFKSPEHELKQQFYITSGDKKGNLNYFTDKKDQKRYLPGFNSVNHICLLTTGEQLVNMETETKVINIYNPELKKEAPTKREVMMDLLGKEISLGVLRVVQPKRVKDSVGNYTESSTETVTINEVDKIFRTADMKTVQEIKAEKEEADFYKAWLEKNKGVDRVKTKRDGAAPTPAASKDVAPKKSLFT
jgi:hypothetical protein